MIKEFIFGNFFLIAKLILFTGVALCIFALHAKSKKSNDMIKDNANIGQDNITSSRETISKKNGKLMGIGVTAVVVGIILLVLGVVAIIMVIYLLMHLKDLFDTLG